MGRSPRSHFHTTAHVWLRVTRQATFRYTTLQTRLYRSDPSRLLPFLSFIPAEKKVTSKVLVLSVSVLLQDGIQRLFQPTYMVSRSITLSVKSSSLKHQTFFEFWVDIRILNHLPHHHHCLEQNHILFAYIARTQLNTGTLATPFLLCHLYLWELVRTSQMHIVSLLC